jgi:hypothetical protein
LRCIFSEKLNRFYQNGEFENTVLPIIRDKNPLAVRDIDWLVTNYSKAFPVVYPNPMNKMAEPFNVHESYEQHELGNEDNVVSVSKNCNSMEKGTV